MWNNVTVKAIKSIAEYGTFGLLVEVECQLAADLPKDSTSFDLAIATSILQASQQIPVVVVDTALFGELGLDGSLQTVRGIIDKVITARDLGLTTIYLPTANLPQALLIPGVTLVPVNQLRDLYLDLTRTVSLKRYTSGERPPITTNQFQIDFKDVVGQARAKRALVRAC